MFLTMIFGLTLVFSGSVSAQYQGKVVGVTGSGKLTPKTGNLVTGGIHQAASDNAAKGIKGGRKYILITVFASSDGKGQQADVVLDIPVNQKETPGVKSRVKITKLENPIPTIVPGDKVLFDTKSSTLIFSRDNTVFGKMTVN